MRKYFRTAKSLNAAARSRDKLLTIVMAAETEKGRSQFGSCGTKSAV
jgi:hypothetical protein